jgi:hypothetical protein
MSLMLYTVLAASGGWVAGQEVAIGSTIALTDAEARYELDLGTIAATGQAPPTTPPPPALLAGDLIETKRGGLDRDVPIASLETFLTRVGGWLATYLAGRDAALTESLSLQGITLDGLRTQLLGGADSAHDTLGKLAALITQAQADVAALQTGKQAAAARLTAFAGLALAADQLIYATGPNTLAVAPLTLTGRQIMAFTSYGALKAAMALSKADIGLSAVDNTSDAAKPVSTAQASAIAAAALTHTLQERAGAPTDLLPGQYRITWNTTTGRPALWMNRSGTVVDAFDPGTF